MAQSFSAPTSPQRRDASIDAIRGIAICGIVFPNIICLLDPDHYFVGVTRMWPEPYNRAAVALVSFVFASKMISMLAFLFGVGMAWQIRKLRKLKRSPRKFFVRRFLALILFGAGNYILFFEGDVLTGLGFTGLLAGLIIPTKLFARKRLALLAICTLVVLLVALTTAISVSGSPDVNEMEISDEAWHWYLYGTYDDTVYFRLTNLTYHIGISLVWTLSVTLPFALLGALCFNSGIWYISGRSPGKVIPLFLWCAVPGVILELIRVIVTKGAAYEPGSADGLATWLSAFTLWSFLPLALAYVLGLRMLFSSANYLRPVAWFAPVGRLALSVYVMQNIILGLLFHGYGLGLMEQIGPLSCIGIALVLNGAMLLFANTYFSYFYQGPLERVWRILTYGWKQVESKKGGA